MWRVGAAEADKKAASVPSGGGAAGWKERTGKQKKQLGLSSACTHSARAQNAQIVYCDGDGRNGDAPPAGRQLLTWRARGGWVWFHNF